MELKEGRYVRTKQGEIHKIKSINEEYIEYENGFGVPYDLKDYYIVKTSNNIIDLIEDGDYVNGVEVIDKEFDNFNEEYLQCGVGDYVICTYKTKEIKSIVTKEQFKSISYKVGE